jgi:hypothetical protein
VITVCFSFNSVLSRRLREAAGSAPDPAFPVFARFRLAAAARAGGADHEANEVTEGKGKRGASECRPRALPPATGVRTFDPFLLSLSGAVLSVTPPLVGIAP